MIESKTGWKHINCNFSLSRLEKLLSYSHHGRGTDSRTEGNLHNWKLSNHKNDRGPPKGLYKFVKQFSIWHDLETHPQKYISHKFVKQFSICTFSICSFFFFILNTSNAGRTRTTPTTNSVHLPHYQQSDLSWRTMSHRRLICLIAAELHKMRREKGRRNGIGEEHPEKGGSYTAETWYVLSDRTVIGGRH